LLTDRDADSARRTEHRQGYRKLSARAGSVHVWESFGLGIVLAFLVSITAGSLTVSRFWEPQARPQAPWCPAGEVPAFQFGFGALAQAIGDAMGTPIECEHADNSTGNTLQATTTGTALYYWCSNVPSFTRTRGQEHWMLTAEGLVHWTGEANPTRALPVVRARDLRHLCPN
jgi:hypothetical protein